MVQDNEVLIEPSEDLAIEIYEAVKKVFWCKARSWSSHGFFTHFASLESAFYALNLISNPARQPNRN